jgi:pimeloyl-ACP methyl ester carboxylesterase
VNLIQDMSGQVVLVGHSMGGLISEQAALEGGIDGVVTIATPHRGSSAAHFLGWPLVSSARDMVPGSDYLTRLISDPRPRPPILAVAARRDGLLRRETAFPHREHQALIAPGNHLGVIYSAKLAAGVMQWMNGLDSTQHPAGWDSSLLGTDPVSNLAVLADRRS